MTTTTLKDILADDEYAAVMDTLLEEVEACKRIGEEDGDEPDRAELLRGAIRKIDPRMSALASG